MPALNSHAVLLLAAGGSRRLGQPKQLLSINGKPLVRHIAELALTTAPTQMIVITGCQAEVVSAALTGLPLQTVFNPLWSQGLASSLQAGAESLRAHQGPVLVLACDQWRLSSAHLDNLLKEAATASTVVTDYGGAEGLPALLPMTLLQQAHLLHGEQGLKTLWHQQPHRAVEAPELAFDIDTPEDLQQAVAAGFGSAST